MKKILIGGSPCTHWSIAQKNNRETGAEGLGWDLFKNYLIAKEKFQPDFFLYENNKSAAQPIKDQISFELGVDLQYINSSLVSAQNRQRFYAHNIPNVPQPEDRGIFLRDVLESCLDDKKYISDMKILSENEMDYMVRDSKGNYSDRWAYLQKPGESDKALCITANIHKGVPYNIVAEPIAINTISDIDKSRALLARYYKNSPINALRDGYGGDTMVAEPAYPIGYRGRNEDGKWVKRYETNDSEKANALTTATTDSMVALTTRQSEDKAGCLRATYYKTGTRNFEENFINGLGYEGVFDYPKEDVNTPIYKVENGLITVKGKQYPIKLQDGYYIIRKFTVKECCRLQTMPDDYMRVVSATQGYKGLGNGWTAEVIIHILKHMNIPLDEEIQVLSMYDGIGTGRYCFDKMGYTNVKYHAYEIDKYAMQVSNSNYPDIIQYGDAFQVREDNWSIK